MAKSYSNKSVFRLTTKSCWKKLVLALSVSGLVLVSHSVETPAHAQASATGKSGLPLPRFVSIKSKRVNMRVGPGKQYQVVWMYLKPGLPMEIIQEFDNWRKVRDPEGNEGWILHSLLSGVRTAIVNPWENDNARGMADLKKTPSNNASISAKLEPGVIARVSSCDSDWCKISVEDVEGYVSKNKIWGVYPDEKIED